MGITISIFSGVIVLLVLFLWAKFRECKSVREIYNRSRTESAGELRFANNKIDSLRNTLKKANEYITVATKQYNNLKNRYNALKVKKTRLKEHYDDLRQRAQLLELEVKKSA